MSAGRKNNHSAKVFNFIDPKGLSIQRQLLSKKSFPSQTNCFPTVSYFISFQMLLCIMTTLQVTAVKKTNRKLSAKIKVTHKF
ncbi:hypothetical protein T11_494 [Trichinella zimbabwensis]|uniref:Uncharacterized protein n=1 Tax=Trichinella zimbabwensis TaxID=268475 RepID=A0A0V1HSK7_9BILA|nr:hypothetical protein T11_494 [Trichinella zimbabwensis]